MPFRRECQKQNDRKAEWWFYLALGGRGFFASWEGLVDPYQNRKETLE